MTDPRYFVVRRWHDREHYRIEHGDNSDRYSKEEQRLILYRVKLPDGYSAPLAETIRLYQSGVRVKETEVAAVVTDGDLKRFRELAEAKAGRLLKSLRIKDCAERAVVRDRIVERHVQAQTVAGKAII